MDSQLRVLTVGLDKPRHWQFDANAVIALHRALGAEPFKRLEALGPRKDESDADRAKRYFTADTFETLRAIVWCGLVSEDSKITPEFVGSKMTPRDMGKILPDMIAAIGESMVDPIPAAEESKPFPLRKTAS